MTLTVTNVTGAIPGVTLNLTSADPATPVTISVAPDTNAVNDAINSFVTEYNTVVGDINAQFTVNSSTNSQGPLGPDSDLRLLQSSLLNDIAYATSDSTSQSSGLSSLAALGISMNNDGTLSVDSATLDSALTSNPAAVANFFSNTNATGFADNFSNDLNNLTAPATGVLNSDLAANQEQQTDLNNEISAFQVHLAEQATALTAEFDQVNASLEQYPFLLQEVTAALGSLSSTGSTQGTLPSTNTAPTSGTAPSGSGSSTGTSGTSGSSGSSGS